MICFYKKKKFSHVYLVKFIFSDTHTYRIKIKSLSKPQLDSANYILFAPMVNLFRGAELRWIFFSNHIRYYPGSSRVSNNRLWTEIIFQVDPPTQSSGLWIRRCQVSLQATVELLHWLYMLTLYSLLLFMFLCAVLGTTCTCIYLYLFIYDMIFKKWFNKGNSSPMKV